MRQFACRAVVAAAALCAATAQATTYYVNTNSWGDGNSGTSNTFPWKTIAKVNSTAVSGDTVLFYRGGVWNETLEVRSGITYGAYGSNTPKPVISGARNAGALTWTRYQPGQNIWVAVTNGTGNNIGAGAVRHLHLNGVRLTRARFPNAGQGAFTNSTSGGSRYNKVTATGDYTTLNVGGSAGLAGQDIVGATAFVRTVGSDLFEYTVNGWKPGSTTALGLTSKWLLDDWDLVLKYDIAAGVGYWLENKLWMLDSPGEWFFEAGTGTNPVNKLYVWMPNGASPAGQALQASTLSSAVRAVNASNFTISDIEVRETLGDAISITGATTATLERIDVKRSGRRGMSIWNASNITIRNANIQDSFGNGLWLGDARGGATASQPVVNANVSFTTINNSGQNGLGMPGAHLGIGGSFIYNTVSNSASAGIIAQSGTSIQYNTVLNSCTDFEDCGGIYVAQPQNDPAKLSSTPGTEPYTAVKASNNMVINSNIVVTGNANPDGTPHEGYGDVRGIYLDDFVNGVTVSNNYVSGMRYGIMLHTTFNNTIQGNRLIGNRSFNLKLQEDQVRDVNSQLTGSTTSQYYNGQMVNNIIQSNAMVASKSTSAPTLAIPNIVQNAPAATGQLASYDLNRYATLNPNRPDILVYNYGTDTTISDMTLANWQAINKDLQGSFRAFRTDGEAYGFYTATGADTRTIACPAINQANCNSFVNLRTGSAVTFPITLPASSSIIVIR